MKDLKKVWGSFIRPETNKLTELISKRNQIIFLLIYSAGLRTSDVINLKKENIIFKDGQSFVNPFDSKDNLIPLPSFFKKTFDTYICLLEEMKLKNNISFDSILFCSNYFKIVAEGLTDRGIQLIFKKYAITLNVNITAKSLRQSYIINWVQLEIPIKTIKSYLNYSDKVQLTIYKNPIRTENYADFSLI